MKENETLIAELRELGVEYLDVLIENGLYHKLGDILSRYPNVNDKKAIVNVVNINYNFSESNRKMKECVHSKERDHTRNCSECTDINRKICMHKGPLFAVEDIISLYHWCRGAVLNEAGKDLLRFYIPLYGNIEEQDFFDVLLYDGWETGIWDALNEEPFQEIFHGVFSGITKPIHTEMMQILEKYDAKFCDASKRTFEEVNEDEESPAYWHDRCDELLQEACEAFWIAFFDKGKHTAWMFDVMFRIHGWNGIHNDIRDIIDEAVDAFR